MIYARGDRRGVVLVLRTGRSAASRRHLALRLSPCFNSSGTAARVARAAARHRGRAAAPRRRTLHRSKGTLGGRRATTPTPIIADAHADAKNCNAGGALCCSSASRAASASIRCGLDGRTKRASAASRPGGGLEQSHARFANAVRRLAGGTRAAAAASAALRQRCRSCRRSSRWPPAAAIDGKHHGVAAVAAPRDAHAENADLSSRSVSRRRSSARGDQSGHGARRWCARGRRPACTTRRRRAAWRRCRARHRRVLGARGGGDERPLLLTFMNKIRLDFATTWVWHAAPQDDKLARRRDGRRGARGAARGEDASTLPLGEWPWARRSRRWARIRSTDLQGDRAGPRGDHHRR